jgi:hypothetical protein
LDRSLAGPKQKAGAKLTHNIIRPPNAWSGKKVVSRQDPLRMPNDLDSGNVKNDDKPGSGKSYVAPF